jgi:hypothetical protein
MIHQHRTLYWQDDVAAGNTVTITYQATVETGATRWITSSTVFHPAAKGAHLIARPCSSPTANTFFNR